MTAPQIIWFRNDLRLADQAAVTAASKAGPVIALYVLDDDTPDKWRTGAAQRWWLHHSLAALAKNARGPAADSWCCDVDGRGRWSPQWRPKPALTSSIRLRHYEPWAVTQAQEVAAAVTLLLHDGAYLTPPEMVTGKTGGRYRIFTPFWRTLRDRLPPPAPKPTPRRIDFAKVPESYTLWDFRILPEKA